MTRRYRSFRSRRGEAATVELHHRAQVGRQHRQDGQDHPLGAVARLAERLDDAQPLGRLLAALARLTSGSRSAARAPARPGRCLLQQVAHRLGAHARLEDAASRHPAARGTRASVSVCSGLIASICLMRASRSALRLVDLARRSPGAAICSRSSWTRIGAGRSRRRVALGRSAAARSSMSASTRTRRTRLASAQCTSCSAGPSRSSARRSAVRGSKRDVARRDLSDVALAARRARWTAVSSTQRACARASLRGRRRRRWRLAPRARPARRRRSPVSSSQLLARSRASRASISASRSRPDLLDQALPRVVVHVGDDVLGEVQHLLQHARRHVEQQADAARACP